MNERIKLLAEQAGGYVSLIHGHEDKLMLLGEDNVQKFAELIVKECISAAEHNPYVTPSTSIKEYFGIKKNE